MRPHFDLPGPSPSSHRAFLRTIGGATAVPWPFARGLCHPLTAEDGPPRRTVAPDRQAPVMDRIPATSFELAGPVHGYVRGLTEQWLKVVPASNPAILKMFRDRDRQPLRSLEPWAGEFAGKYLTSAVQVYRLHRDPALKAVLPDFVTQLIACQDTDGYLGPCPKPSRLTGLSIVADELELTTPTVQRRRGLVSQESTTLPA